MHTNSGVNNKTLFLITDGGTFNGQTVTGLGETKAADIYYEVATTMLTSGSDYADLGTGLVQACQNLIGVDGITAAELHRGLPGRAGHRDGHQPAELAGAGGPGLRRRPDAVQPLLRRHGGHQRELVGHGRHRLQPVGLHPGLRPQRAPAASTPPNTGGVVDTQRVPLRSTWSCPPAPACGSPTPSTPTRRPRRRTPTTAGSSSTPPTAAGPGSTPDRSSARTATPGPSTRPPAPSTVVRPSPRSATGTGRPASTCPAWPARASASAGASCSEQRHR